MFQQYALSSYTLTCDGTDSDAAASRDATAVDVAATAALAAAVASFIAVAATANPVAPLCGLPSDLMRSM